MSIPDYLQLILQARVYDVATETPLTHAINLSDRLKNNVLLKREDLQSVFSFKLRGAYNKMYHLSDEEKSRGVISVSAGNHAQGVALAARKLNIPAIIVMPLCTPAIKYKNVQRLGAEVVLYGDDFDEAKVECMRLMKEKKLAFIHPFDDPYTIAGQGTMAIEIMKQSQAILSDTSNAFLAYRNEDIDAIFCAVGGGGMIAGITAFIKQIFPHVKVIGVETEDANGMYVSLEAKRRVLLEDVGLFADGAAVKLVGQETFRICYGNREGGNSPYPGIDEVILVTNDEICSAIRDVFVDTRSVLEPAGALGVAGLKKYVQKNKITGKSFVAVTSGANMNFDRLRFVAERASLGDDKEAMISAIIPEKPGSFMALYDTIAPRSVTEFSYRYSNDKDAHIIMSFEVSDRKKDVKSILESLEQKGMKGTDLSENEVAKAHARYLIGGRFKVRTLSR